MAQLNEDILRHIVSYLSPKTLKEVNAAHRIFFDEWMKSRYASLAFTRNNKQLLDHLSDPYVAKYVKRAVIRPWLINPTRPTHTFWTNINEILGPDHVRKDTQRRLQECLRNDSSRLLCALNAMKNIEEYLIEWNEESDYHPELYKACFTPMSQTWTGQLTKLTIKVPPQLLKWLASVRLGNLKTLEYHFCTGQMSSQDIDEMHHGFLVFVNNLRDSLEGLSFVSTHTSLTLDMTRIYKALGPFPKLHSISLSVPYDGAHLSNPLVFVRFLEKHRSTLKGLSILTCRSTVHSTPGDPESNHWIQKILTSVDRPFPRLRSLALSMRPLRASLTNVSNFLDMHMSTLDSLTLVDRSLDYHEFECLLRTANGTLDLRGLRHLRVKVNDFDPSILFYLASKMPGLASLDIECGSNVRVNGENAIAFFNAIKDSGESFFAWKLKRMTIGPQTQDWEGYIQFGLAKYLPSLVISKWRHT